MVTKRVGTASEHSELTESPDTGKPTMLSQVETSTTPTTPTTPSTTSQPPISDDPSTQQTVKGRAVFAVETTAAGVVVRTAFLTEEQRLLDMPAVFPDVMYAMNVIDELKTQVMQHFSQAAQVGAQVIANQARAQKEQESLQSPQSRQSPQTDVQAAGTGGSLKQHSPNKL
jgi:hypothetical protein